MEKTNNIWIDGALVAWDDAKIHVLTHGLHYGSGVFEGIRCYRTDTGGAVFRLTEHVDRFFYSAEKLGIAIPFSPKDIRNAIVSLVQANKISECYIRPVAFYGYGNMSLDVSSGPGVSVAIAIWPWGAYLGGTGVTVHISKYRRLHPDSVAIDAKITGHYATSVAATIEAKQAGTDEALFLDAEGNVAEGPGENVFMVKNGALYTPPRGSILPGITRDTVLTIASNNGIVASEQKITLEELLQADELFFTGTAAEICPIIEANGTRIGQGAIGPITEHIKNIYGMIVRGKDEQYKNWLTTV